MGSNASRDALLPEFASVIEDDQHALFDCLVYADMREAFSDLLQDHCRTLVRLFSIDQDYTRLAKFGTLCRERRVRMSAIGFGGRTSMDIVRIVV
jgi:hypothetical protein